MGFHSCLMSETKDVSGDVTLSLQMKVMRTFARIFLWVIQIFKNHLTLKRSSLFSTYLLLLMSMYNMIKECAVSLLYILTSRGISNQLD